MSLLQKLFGKNKADMKNPDMKNPDKLDIQEPTFDYKAIMADIDCPYEYFPPSNDIWPAQAAWLMALRESKEKGGFTPVLLVLEENIDLISFSPEERNRLLSIDLPDGHECLAELLAELKSDMDGCYEDVDYWNKEIVGEMTGGSKMQMLITGWAENMVRSYPLLLLKIPTEKPWEIFAWLQFGGWNACPMPEIHMAVCKYWYEKYQARPLIIAADIIEYHLEKPVPYIDAMELAAEQCGFCSDIVLQGTGTIGALADSLHRSHSWYFWWD